jgi:putative membrane protein
MGLDYLMIPISLIISFVFSILAKVGEVNEDPFENRVTDVPLSALCNTIERDLLEMLGETKLPVKMQPVEQILY